MEGQFLHIEHIDVHLLLFFLFQHHDSPSETIDFSLLVLIFTLERRDSPFEIVDRILLVSVLRLEVPDRP